MPLPPGSVHVDIANKMASLDISHQKIDDYGNVVRALTGAKELTRGTIDVELHWTGGAPADAAISTDNFTGHYLPCRNATPFSSPKDRAHPAFPTLFSFPSY